MAYLSFVKKIFVLDAKTVYHDVFDKKDPDEFRATGSQIYHGRQRQGKTLGMIHAFHRLKRRYPKLLVVSNLTLFYLIRFKTKKFWIFTLKVPFKYMLDEVEVNTLDELKAIMTLDEFKSGLWQQTHYIRYRTYEQLLMLLRNARNGKWGVDFMIDEIHQYFHSHDSKSMPVWVAQIFSQQMKQYVLVVGTVQKWPNVIKALREQIEHLILSTKHGWWIRQVVVDPEEIENEYGVESAPIKKTAGFFMTKIVRESYDTLALVESGREIFGGGDSNTIIAVKDAQKSKPRFNRKRATLR